MCGRYGRRADKQRIAEWFQTRDTDVFSEDTYDNWDCRPGSIQPVVAVKDGERRLKAMRWGINLTIQGMIKNVFSTKSDKVMYLNYGNNVLKIAGASLLRQCFSSEKRSMARWGRSTRFPSLTERCLASQGYGEIGPILRRTGGEDVLDLRHDSERDVLPVPKSPARHPRAKRARGMARTIRTSSRTPLEHSPGREDEDCAGGGSKAGASRADAGDGQLVWRRDLMAKVTDFECADEAGHRILCDAFGNNVGIRMSELCSPGTSYHPVEPARFRRSQSCRVSPLRECLLADSGHGQTILDAHDGKIGPKAWTVNPLKDTSPELLELMKPTVDLYRCNSDQPIP
jgi:hypothetical protein